MNTPEAILTIGLLSVLFGISVPARAEDPAVDAAIRQMQDEQEDKADAVQVPAKQIPRTANDADLAACSEIDNSVDRLACFDGVAKARGAVSPVTSTPAITGTGRWIVDVETSKIDDSKNVFVRLTAEEPISGRLGQKEWPRLVLTCQENATDATIWLGGFWYSDREQVTARIDKRKARKATWSESTDHEWMFHPTAISFIREMMTGAELFVATAPINEGQVEMTFKIAGLANAIKPLQEACHWQ